jgi:hypothetical protein
MASKIPLEELHKKYIETNNVWKTAKYFGLCGQSVHERLSKNGLIHKMNVLSDVDKQKIILFYQQGFECGDNKLKELAKELNRTKNYISRYAKEQGLTNKNRKYTESNRLNMSVIAKNSIAKNGHPKGMLNKKHSKETLEVLSIRSKQMWERMSDDKKNEKVMKMLKTKVAKYGSACSNVSANVTWKQGWREIGGVRKFYRSRWEANYGRYLEFLRVNGKIQSWKHESKTFWFEGIKRGCRSYLPDFLVVNNDGTEEYHEVKGYMDSRSLTKLKRMKKYYPEVKLLVVGAEWFKANMKRLREFVPDIE